MFSLFVVIAAAAPLPPECELPQLRDVTPLRAFAQASGTLSAGLDSVATWCFDSEGKWTGGLPGAKKPPKEPLGECMRATATCEKAAADISPEVKQLLSDALADMQRPYLGARYVPKRSGLGERPSDASDCRSKARSELFTQASSRMDVARLAANAMNEYANYKTWLNGLALRCEKAVKNGQLEALRKGISVDAPVDKRSGALVVPLTAEPVVDAGLVVTTGGSVPAALVDAGASTPTLSAGGGLSSTGLDAGPAQSGVVSARVDAGSSFALAGSLDGGGRSDAMGFQTPDTAGAVERVRAGPVELGRRLDLESVGRGDAGLALVAAVNAQTMLERWRRLSVERAKFELDRDYVAGFLASRELRDCRCPRPNPALIVKRLETNDNVAQLEADELKNSSCEQCLGDAFVSWKRRVEKQCALLPQLTEFEVGALERSDDGNGLPPRCLESRRVDAGVAARAAGAPSVSNASAPQTVAGTPVAGSKVVVQPVTPQAPVEVLGAEKQGGAVMADNFVRPQDYAPIPLREDGRLYLRIFMSSACVAEVLPGPLQARTGDLLLIPLGSKSLSVKSPCGGLAEVYWGREPSPRVSELFGRHQPLTLQFKAQ